MTSRRGLLIFPKFWFFRLLGRSKGKKWRSRLSSHETYIIWSSFMVHMCKRIISPGFLHFFQILIFWVSSKVKEQKWSKMTKKCVCHTPYLRKHTSYDCGFWYTCFKWWYLQMFSSLFQNFDFQVVRGCKKAKNGPSFQKIVSVSVSSVSQELHLKWLCFLVHMCKMMISPAIFFSFFRNFDFLVFREGGGGDVKGQ